MTILSWLRKKQMTKWMVNLKEKRWQERERERLLSGSGKKNCDRLRNSLFSIRYYWHCKMHPQPAFSFLDKQGWTRTRFWWNCIVWSELNGKWGLESLNKLPCLNPHDCYIISKPVTNLPFFNCLCFLSNDRLGAWTSTCNFCFN